MYRVIEGIYQKGKISVPKVINIKDDTQVLIVFSDASYRNKTVDRKEMPIEISLESFDKSETPKLDDIDVSVSTKVTYLKELSMQISGGEDYTNSAFFSSKPIDIGYTEASILNNIIESSKK